MKKVNSLFLSSSRFDVILPTSPPNYFLHPFNFFGGYQPFTYLLYCSVYKSVNYDNLGKKVFVPGFPAILTELSGPMFSLSCVLVMR